MDNFDQVKRYCKYFVDSNIDKVLKKFAPMKKTIFNMGLNARKGYKRDYSRSLMSPL